MINCTLAELVTRRMRDYGIEGEEQLMEATGLSLKHVRLIVRGEWCNVGIKARRALDLDPGVIERSVRR